MSKYSLPNTELLTTHFGFVPIAFIDDIINAVNDLIYQAADIFEKYVDDRLSDPEECENGMHQVITLLEHVVDKNFDIFELYALNNIFTIPPDVSSSIVLPHQEGLDYSIDAAYDEKLDEELEVTRKQLLASKVINFKLRQDIRKTNAKLARQEKIIQQLSCIKEMTVEQNLYPLPETVKLLVDQLIAVKNLIIKLHDQVDNGKLTENNDQNSDERMVFIKRMTSMMVERTLKKRKDSQRSDYKDDYEVGEGGGHGRKRVKTHHQHYPHSSSSSENDVPIGAVVGEDGGGRIGGEGDDEELKALIEEANVSVEKLTNLQKLRSILLKAAMEKKS
ncbi:4321_t:CDS:2 [Ambispora leptoticha]|uniref:4321_t:CDS:1 n=1 Tax=Ambispora leptoticha TaxID=144679 RepID=A0A9N8VGS1_9GLOM|nr:4321_t:CDS:2 [Ambispora leptoticha]